jgi:hypothetical protein
MEIIRDGTTDQIIYASDYNQGEVWNVWRAFSNCPPGRILGALTINGLAARPTRRLHRRVMTPGLRGNAGFYAVIDQQIYLPCGECRKRMALFTTFRQPADRNLVT